MQLTPDYLISECGCPQQISNAIEFPANMKKENYFPSSKLRYHNYITSSRRRLLPRRESLSDYYDKLLVNSTAPMAIAMTITTNTTTDISKRQQPMQADTLKHMKCAMNEAIRKADKHCSRNQHSVNIEDSNKKQYR
ncbi:uncharacterized protein LOC129939802 [Eupeodes corollae]|uniref:uncharacterized protein LOC129939802 n=1 Tax=Eupeodes corollae TaxID=290404 RepID=UPI0024923845|nr:uncharacterized protein LOC129939802 [Eupeodes corollae]XP_055903933.1 uncharacterized protein LOC129939802 [Eupeodes corollae]XP_055903934.1 uncharacterized protein LOC129939802 [Eupeodes corollae]XP_055903935.1 uncharacterized protein LOC129939802 [Eupeodes corollae]